MITRRTHTTAAAHIFIFKRIQEELLLTLIEGCVQESMNFAFGPGAFHFQRRRELQLAAAADAFRTAKSKKTINYDKS